jgi:hypothetical protein
MVVPVPEESVITGRQDSDEPVAGRGGDYDQPMVMSYMLLRKSVGVIGVFLPFVLFFGNKIIGYGVQPSVSGYYYTPMRNIYIGALCALAIFLITYDGWDRADTVITNIAGICVVGAAWCPTSLPGATGHQVVIGVFHLSFAAAAFVMLALMSLRFAKRTPTPPGLPFWSRVGYALGFTPAGASRTTTAELVIYRSSGLAILICLALIYPMSKVYADSLLVLEMIMMVSFGAAWLVKGTTLLRRNVVPAPASPA